MGRDEAFQPPRVVIFFIRLADDPERGFRSNSEFGSFKDTFALSDRAVQTSHSLRGTAGAFRNSIDAIRHNMGSVCGPHTKSLASSKSLPFGQGNECVRRMIGIPRESLEE